MGIIFGWILPELELLGQEQVGQKFGDHYEIIQVLGSGGMGTVCKARETGLDRIVAIKILQIGKITDPESRQRFELEGKILSDLSNKHIVIFYRFGVNTEGVPYIVTEFLDGPSLRSLLIEQGSLDWRRAINIGVQICEALVYAHRAGVVHRDLKPDNVIVLQEEGSDLVKLVDFGLAKLLPGAEQSLQKLTRTGELIGSVNYMSPEQCLGHPSDKRSDIYSLACVLYELIAGQPPLNADNPVGLIYKHANEMPPELAEISRDKNLPGGLDQVLFKAMAKSPDERYQSMEEFQSDLACLLSGSLSALSTLTQNSGEKRRTKKRLPIASKMVAAVCAPLLILLITFLAYEPAIAMIVSPIIELRGDQQSVDNEQAFAEQLARMHKTRAAAALYDRAYKLQQKIDKRSLNLVALLLQRSTLGSSSSKATHDLQVAAVTKLTQSLGRFGHVGKLSKQENELLDRLVEQLANTGASYWTEWKERLSKLSSMCCAIGDFDAALKVEDLRQKIVEHQFGKRAKMMDLALERGHVLILAGRTNESEKMFATAANAAHCLSGQTPRDIMRWQSLIGMEYFKNGMNQLAMRHCQQVKNYFCSNPASEPDPYLQGYDTFILAEIFLCEGQIDKAMDLYRKGIQLFHKSDARESDIDNRLKNAAEILSIQGHNKEAIEFIKIALNEKPDPLKPRNSDYAVLITFLADAYCRTRNFSEAQRIYDRLILHTTPVNEDNSLLAMLALTRAGEVATLLHENKMAIDYLKRAVKISEKYYPVSQPQLEAMSNLAAAYHANGQHEIALQMIEKANKIVPLDIEFDRIRCLVWTRLYQLYFFLHRDKDGEHYAYKTLEWLKKNPNAVPGHEVGVLENLILVYRDRGDYKKCLELLERQYNYITKHQTICSVVNICVSTQVVVACELRLGNLEKAQTEFQKWNKLAIECDKEGHRRSADFEFVRATLLHAEHRDREAAEIYKKILVAPRSTAFLADAFEMESMKNYAKLLKESGDIENANAWAKKAEQLRQVILKRS